MSRRTIIIGGGSIGLALAWELSNRDVRVTLIERDEVGKATSWAAAGILPPANFATATDPVDRLRGLSHQLFPQWADRLKSETQIDPGFRRCGGWYLANTPGERAAMVAMNDYWREMDIRCDRATIDDVAKREPEIADWLRTTNNTAAWWVPDECQLRSPDYLRALTQACRNNNVAILQHAGVQQITNTPSSVHVKVRSQGDSHDVIYDADSVVVCAGSWTGMVDPSLRLQRSIVPVRGQILLLKTDTPLIRSVVNVGHRYLVARDDGHTLVGSCEEEVGLQLGTTPEVLDSLREFAINLCPQLAHAVEVDAWSGLRPMTFDAFPMIGRVPDTANVYVAAGHYRSGLHLSPATAVVLADLVTGQPATIDIDAFRVGKQQHHS
ncbi:MAG: FAD-dependent oxidoreductase [Pirellulaceae bacterium]|nr:FAD-dependent oxidoreductase [Pirellulaceae bacterium]